jgi:rhodanese-related sulfurtransferase
MQSGQPVVVLDIREPDETAKGYIEGALLLPRGRLEGRIEDLVPDKNACIIAH